MNEMKTGFVAVVVVIGVAVVVVNHHWNWYHRCGNLGQTLCSFQFHSFVHRFDIIYEQSKINIYKTLFSCFNVGIEEEEGGYKCSWHYLSTYVYYMLWKSFEHTYDSRYKKKKKPIAYKRIKWSYRYNSLPTHTPYSFLLHHLYSNNCNYTSATSYYHHRLLASLNFNVRVKCVWQIHTFIRSSRLQFHSSREIAQWKTAQTEKHICRV